MTAAALAGEPDTFPKYLLLNAERLGDRPAMRHKDFGIWQSWTWREQLDQIVHLALGLRALGLARGDKIAIIGANRPRLYWTFAAAQSLGAVPVPVYADAVADEMAYVLDHAGVRFAVVQDQEQVDKIDSSAERIPALKTVIYDEPRGLARLRPWPGCTRSPTCRPPARRWSPRIPALAGAGAATSAAASGDEISRHALHVRHDRPFQGRDAQGRRARCGAARDTVAFDRLTEQRQRARLSAARLGRRPLSQLRAGLCRRLLRQLPGKRRDRRAGSARDRRRPSISRRRGCSSDC